jgi:hypothetical protein
MHRQDVRVLEPSGESNLAVEAFRPQGRCEFRMQHLERDGPIVPQVMGEIDRGHATTAELALDDVTIA